MFYGASATGTFLPWSIRLPLVTCDQRTCLLARITNISLGSPSFYARAETGVGIDSAGGLVGWDFSWELIKIITKRSSKGWPSVAHMNKSVTKIIEKKKIQFHVCGQLNMRERELLCIRPGFEHQILSIFKFNVDMPLVKFHWQMWSDLLEDGKTQKREEALDISWTAALQSSIRFQWSWHK